MFAERVLRTLESEARGALASALAPVPGPKTLLVDDTLFNSRLSVARPLDLFTDATFLREHGVRSIAPLSSYIPPVVAVAPSNDKTTSDQSSSSTKPPALVIIIRGINAAAAKSAATAILAHIKSKNKFKPQCLVLTTPRRSRIVEKVMRVSGLADTIPIASLPLGFLPFDADLITLDWPEAFRQVVLDGDNSAILATASAITAFADALHVRFTTIRSAGAAAAAVVEEILQTHGQTYATQRAAPPSYPTQASYMSSTAGGLFAPEDAFKGVKQPHLKKGKDERGNEHVNLENNNTSPGAGHQPTLADVSSKEPERHGVTLIVIDRRADTVTPLLTQWTYEGLMDEAIGLHNNVLDLPVSSIISDDAISILRTSSGGPGTVRKRLRGDVDRIFAKLRDLNYWAAARQIATIAHSVRNYYDARPVRETAEISQVKDYVKGLRQVKSEHASATAHTAIAAEISARTFDSLEFKRRFEIEREMVEGGAGLVRRVYITDAIAKGESLSHVIRLCCLWSLTSNGIPGDDLTVIKNEMLASYGLGVLPLLTNLERAGLMVRSLRDVAQTNLSWIPIPRFGSVGAGGGGVGGIMNNNDHQSTKDNNQNLPSFSMTRNKSSSSPNSSNTDGMTMSSTSTSTSTSAMNNNNGNTGGTTSGNLPSSLNRSASARSSSTSSRVSAEYSWQFSRAALRLVTDFDPEHEVRPGTAAAISAPYSGYTPLTARLAEAALSEDGWAALPHVAAHNLLLPHGHTTVEHGQDQLDRVKISDHHLLAREPQPVSPGFDAVVVVVGGIIRAEASAIRLAAKATGIKTIIATTAVTGPDEFVLSLSDRT